MPSAYLQSADYAAFGAPNATAAQVTQASVLIDAYVRWPSGMVCINDGNGLPAYMAALVPRLTLNSVGTIAPGTAVQVPVTGPLATCQIGDCVVLDKAAPSTTETVQITAISGQVATLSVVAFAHLAGCTIETGMIITEARYVPRQRSEVTLSLAPVARVIGGTGRYAYGRRGDAGYSNMDDFNLLSAVTQFGGPPLWEIWPANSPAGVDADTGRVWVPAGVMLAYYSEVKIRYVAGFAYANLPAEIKLACAQIINALVQDPQIGNFKMAASGDTKMERFAASNLSDDIKSMLQPWRARAFA
jgi:hypothetical protein